MKHLLAHIVLIVTISGTAQSIPRSVIGSSGLTVIHENGGLGFTFGETVIGYATKELSLDQGFWAQSLLNSITNLDPLGEVYVEVNPVGDELIIDTQNAEVQHMTLYSVNGQKVMDRKLDFLRARHAIDLSHFSKGVYILQVAAVGLNSTRLFKILKN